MRNYEIPLNTPPVQPNSSDSTSPEAQSERQEPKLEKCNRFIKELEIEAVKIKKWIVALPEHNPIEDLGMNPNALLYEYSKGEGFNTEKPASLDTIRKGIEQEYINCERRSDYLESTDEKTEEINRAKIARTELLAIFTDPNKKSEQEQILLNHETKNNLESELFYVEDELSKLKAIRSQLERAETVKKTDKQSRQTSDSYMEFQKLKEEKQRRFNNPKHKEMMSLLGKYLREKDLEKKA